MKLSLKYKILGTLILLPAIALMVFVLMASDVFITDKMAYIYETSFKHNKSLLNNTKFQNEKFSTLIKFYAHLIINNSENQQIQLILNDPSLIGFRVFKTNKGKLFEKNKYSKLTDYKFEISLDQYQEKYNQITDEVYIDYDSSNESELKVLLRDSFSGYLIEGIFDLTSLAKEYKKDKLFYNYLATQTKTFFTQDSAKLDNNKILEEIVSKKNTSGVFESKFSSNIVSFNQLSHNVWAVSILNKDKALSVLDVLKTKSSLFILAIISLSIILSVIASRKLTGNLKVLSLAAQEIGNGDFSTKVSINANDEIGILANSFNQMSNQIGTLLNELEEYNRTLEQKVEERTFELKQAMEMQNTILDSVDQGFVLLNKDLSILPVYSKASTSLFDGNPSEKNLPTLLHLEGSQASEIETYFNMAIEEMMPFNDMMITAPSHFINDSKREIFLQYMPVRDEKKNVEKVVLVATDKTDEIEALKKLENQKAKVQMILKLASNSKSYLSFESQTIEYIDKMKTMLLSEKALDRDIVARMVHTIKGNAAVYSLKEIVDLSHNFEELIKSGSIKNNIFSNYLQEVLKELKNISEEFSAIVRPENMEQFEGVTLLKHEIEKVKQMLQQDDSLHKINDFFEFLTKSEVLSDKINVLENEANVMSEKLNKKLNVLVSGKDIRVPVKRFDELFSNMIHLVRNALDHGIEKSDRRKELGKSEVATLKISSSIENDKTLVIKVIDDGQGINIKKVEQKLKENGIDTSNISPEQMPYMIFHDGLSTSDEITDVSGRGVGVSSVKEVVEKMNGSIVINTQINKGTMFLIKVPLFENQTILKAA